MIAVVLRVVSFVDGFDDARRHEGERDEVSDVTLDEFSMGAWADDYGTRAALILQPNLGRADFVRLRDMRDTVWLKMTRSMRRLPLALRLATTVRCDEPLLRPSSRRACWCEKAWPGS